MKTLNQVFALGLLAILSLSGCISISDSEHSGMTTTGNTASIKGTLSISQALAKKRLSVLNSDSLQVYLIDSTGAAVDSQIRMLETQYEFDSLSAGVYVIWASQVSSGFGSDSIRIQLGKGEQKQQDLLIQEDKGYASNCIKPVWEDFAFVSSPDSTLWYLSGVLTSLTDFTGGLGFLHYSGVAAADFIDCGNSLESDPSLIRQQGTIYFTPPGDPFSSYPYYSCVHISRNATDGDSIRVTLSAETRCGIVDTTMTIPTRESLF